MINQTLNITEVGMHIINFTCPECFNISSCPLPITQYGSSYTANWIFLSILISAIIFIMYHFYEYPFKAFGIATGVAIALSFVGGLFGWMSGLPLLIIVVIITITTLLNYREKIGI